MSELLEALDGRPWTNGHKMISINLNEGSGGAVVAGPQENQEKN